MYAPIVLFAYKRPYELSKTIEALKNNYLATESELFVFVDGPKRAADISKVEQVRGIVQKASGFKKIHLFLSQQNKGCARSIIDGVTYVLSYYSTTIVVEDDIVTAPNFLDYMNQCLLQYAGNSTVFSIGGYTFPFAKPTEYSDDVYFIGRTCAWGWGIWADRWKQADWDVTDYSQFIQSRKQRQAFNKNGSDRVRMLRRTMQGEVDTWDIRLCYAQFKYGGYTVYPTVSKVENIGFYSSEETNTSVFNRYKTIVDIGVQRIFNLPITVSENAYYTRQFRHKFSIGVRIANRLKTLAGWR